MSDNTETDALLTLAGRIDEADERPIVIHNGAAAELRRLVAENETLRGELAEQAHVNGEREARLMAVNAELVESNRAMLRHCMKVMQEEADAYLAWNNDTNATLLAEIAALKEYLNDKG